MQLSAGILRSPGKRLGHISREENIFIVLPKTKKHENKLNTIKISENSAMFTIVINTQIRKDERERLLNFMTNYIDKVSVTLVS